MENEHIYIELSNIHYLSELNVNLILLKVLEEKECEFCIIDGFLKIKDKEDDIMLKSIGDNNLYLFQQPKFLASNGPCKTMTKA